MSKLKIPFKLNQTGGVVNNILGLLKNISNEIKEKDDIKEGSVKKQKSLTLIKASKTKDIFKKKKTIIKTRTKKLKRRTKKKK